MLNHCLQANPLQYLDCHIMLPQSWKNTLVPDSSHTSKLKAKGNLCCCGRNCKDFTLGPERSLGTGVLCHVIKLCPLAVAWQQLTLYNTEQEEEVHMSLTDSLCWFGEMGCCCLVIGFILFGVCFPA